MRETFINPLLHPYANASSSTVIEYDDLAQVETLVGPFEHSKIASRFFPSPLVVADDSSSEDEAWKPSGSRVLLPVVEIAYGGIAPHQLPDDLRRCLESIEGILADHLKLVKTLRKRYDEQYPLVRSLTDIFLANVRIVPGYPPLLLP